MKKVLGWVKGNLLIVVIIVVALVAIPVMLYFSSGWNRSIREEVRSDASQTMSKINQLPVTYEIPGMLTSDGQTWQSDKVAPNPVINERMREVLSRLSSESEAVRELAVGHNSRGKELLVDGDSPEDRLFPRPSDEGARVRLLTELTRARPVAYAALLEEAGAGMPPEPSEVMRTLEARRTRLIQERVQGRVDQTLSEEEREEIREELSRIRMDLYTQRAERLTFYADPAVFVGVREWAPDEGLPSLETAWAWQMEYWIAEDLIDAFEKANTDASGLQMTVPRAPVKRVLAIEVEPLSAATSLAKTGGGGGGSFTASRGGGRGGFDDDAGGGPPMPGDPNAPVQTTYSVAFTGRAGYPVAPNALYDVRYARVSLVVDMNRIPRVIDAISNTNFMSVIDLDIEAVDPADALDDGFVYGGDAAARVDMLVETIWLRSWRAQWMPPEVKQRLGVPEAPEPTEGEADGA